MKFLFFLVFSFLTLFAFEVQKPKIYDEQNISNWIMSEKLDGIRGYWDGKRLYTKNGNPINTPKYFTKNFPPFALDGELWSKRNDFEFIQSTVLDKIPSKNWNTITYNIFEVPNSKGNFHERLKKAQTWFEQNPNKYIKVIPQTLCKNEIHLQKYLNEITTLKGEGVIVKDPTQPYHTGRSPHILKVKKAQDMEAIVIGYNYRNDGVTLKSLKVKLSNAIVFNLGGRI